MLKEALISMKTVQNVDSPNAEKLEFMTEGLYGFEDGTGYITYAESEVTGMDGTMTSVLVMDDCVVVDRDGNFVSRMIFKEGEKNGFVYETPFGRANMDVRTRHLSKHFDESGGEFEIDYVVAIEHKAISQNSFTLSVKLTGGNENA